MHQYSQYRIEKITTPFKSRLECNDNTTLRTGVALIFLLSRNMLFLNGKVGAGNKSGHSVEWPDFV